MRRVMSLISLGGIAVIVCRVVFFLTLSQVIGQSDHLGRQLAAYLARAPAPPSVFIAQDGGVGRDRRNERFDQIRIELRAGPSAKFGDRVLPGSSLAIGPIH